MPRGKRVRGMAAVGVLLGMAGAAWWGSAALRRGQIELTNAGPLLVAQLLPDHGAEPLGEPFEVASRVTLSLPEGDYRLRVHGQGRLGRTWRLAVHAGETQSHALTLDEGRLLGRWPSVPFMNQPRPREEPIAFTPDLNAVSLTPGRADFIERSATALIRRNAASGEVTWRVAPVPGRPGEPAHPTTWLDHLLAHYSNGSGGGPITPAADLNGDGTADLVWPLSEAGALLALSGADGSILWDFAAALDGPGVSRPDGPDLRPGPNLNQWNQSPEPVPPGGRWRQILGAAATPDLDADGVPDLVATVLFSETEEEASQRLRAPLGQMIRAGRRLSLLNQRRLVAVSGRSGRSLWTRPLDEGFTTVSADAYNRPLKVVPTRGSGALLALVEGDHCSTWDAVTGQPRGGPIDLGFTPVRSVQFADLDGDGVPEILALGAGSTPAPLTLAAFSGITGRALWQAPVEAKYESLFGQMPPPRWPLVADLDGDGRPEIAVADSGPLPPGPGYRGVRLLDGSTGQTRWTRPMRPETVGTDGLHEVIAAPDLDGDGVRDLVTTSMFLGRSPRSSHEGTAPVPERAYIDAISGRDGRSLWFWHRALPTDKLTQALPLRWWGRGPDGWPLLAVALGGYAPGSTSGDAGTVMTPVVHNLVATTGEDLAPVPGLTSVGVADLDGDGLTDLWGDVDGQLQAFAGEAPVAWRALGQFASAEILRSSVSAPSGPPIDLDGDGTGDVLSTGLGVEPPVANAAIASRALQPALARGFAPAEGAVPPPLGSQTAVARSGRDGHLLWRNWLGSSGLGLGADHGVTFHLTTDPLPGGDLDGDGVADVIVQATRRFGATASGLDLKHAATLPVRALSGRTGRLLWAAGPLPLGFRAFGDSRVTWTQALAVAAGQPPDLLVGHSSPFDPQAPPSPGPNASTRPRLARLAGDSGAIRWDVPLGTEGEQAFSFVRVERRVADLDGDGSLDLVTTGSAANGYGVRAVALRDGRILWERRLNFTASPMDQPNLVVADLDGDGRAEILIDERPTAPDNTPQYNLTLFDGRDGQPRWTYRPRVEGPGRLDHWHFLADLDGRGQPSIGISTSGGMQDYQGLQHLVILDARGQVRAERNLVGEVDPEARVAGSGRPLVADLTGDGRAELIFYARGRHHVWGPDLAELWSRPSGMNYIKQVIPGRGADQHPRLLFQQPLLALDATGRTEWAGLLPRSGGSAWPSLLDAGGPDRRPLLVFAGSGTTVGVQALATDPDDAIKPPQGALVPPGPARRDPRWTRPLPWVAWVHRADLGPLALVAVALAVVNVGVPLLLLALVAGRRARSLRLVVAVPAAAALPILVYMRLEPSIPLGPTSLPTAPWLLYALATLVGLLILNVPALVGLALARRRWRSLGALLAATLVASLVVGGAWVGWDRRTMPALERYGPAGWGWVVVPGALVAGLAGLLLGVMRWLGRRIVKTG